jgi:hypothetical protein
MGRERDRRVSRLVLAGCLAIGLALAGTLVAVVANSEQTRECTIESMTTIHTVSRKSPDHLRIDTAECGRIRADRDGRTDVVNPDCPYDVAEVGARYRMTTRGFDGLPSPLDQRLVGPMIVVADAPGAVCVSDGWLTED